MHEKKGRKKKKKKNTHYAKHTQIMQITESK